MNTFQHLKRLFPVDISDVLTVDAGVNSHGLDAVDAEGQDIFIIDCIYEGVDVQLISEGLLNCGRLRILHGGSHIRRKNLRFGESEYNSYYYSLYTQ